MTNLEAIQSLNAYPIPVVAIEKICIDNGLEAAAVYNVYTGSSRAFQLAMADFLVLVHAAPSLVEQSVGINNAIAIKQELLDRANKIYALYGSDKFTGNIIGFIGEDFNG